ncbi:DUF3592 domain-containing protein [Streptomyces lydicus]|uniref:DUF3592 domain-containing protein n=1 Tax=Streptomyces lydicus TaxID=47763 RepID=UPI000A73F561|nr:DUF3592 domain-containing protein [Streptomyces lydicus]MDC7341006.1 DUF3592 domain-containing protein [Streptomyces lydicus]UEG89311.1 DUF3592 domain-containing protein [Streptomyces lydicus]
MTTREVIGFVLAVLASLLCLWGGVREARLQARLRRYGVHTEGLVVDQKMAPADDHLTPVIEFTDRQGRPVRFTPVATGSRMGMDLGTHVPVAYLPEQPENARVSTRKHRRSHVGLFTGSVIFLGGAVWVWLTR